MQRVQRESIGTAGEAGEEEFRISEAGFRRTGKPDEIEKAIIALALECELEFALVFVFVFEFAFLRLRFSLRLFSRLA